MERWCKEWHTLTFYQKFEQVVAWILTFVIALIILISLYDLLLQTFLILFKFRLNPLEHKVFQTLFGMFMTVLIALEFKHSILKVTVHKEGIVQVKTVVLIALLALTRKFIILDFKGVAPLKIFALAFSVLVLGIIYWLLREQSLRYKEE
ncbi:hypothetical protein Thein_0338 [Thermodesulfatator indicus DSM 15286]|uniref:Diguanylate cyclase n=1 Tax=Thermodesulfatator indicus (strain DSM 15286 / JCM 11887 / CIR29812) TaxID=667014 RepID=F8AA85_THEID|nr:phosphate-starvation-inducible PsiE family protein [Thermodesulfatator indicus]AEH44221.1 hypothetical protein Thein_0338 [Thermodesulfatator indicus DSM 15286]